MKVFNMKRIFTCLLLALLCAGLQGQNVQPYLSQAEVRSSLALLPPPPQEGSVEFLLDKLAFWEYFNVRYTDPERAEQAVTDADMKNLGEKFSEAFGLPITRETMPETWLLITRSRECFGSSGCDEAKQHYMRTRPFVYFSVPTLLPGSESWLRINGSYPSGHTANFFGIAYILAELRPDRTSELLARANEGGISRLIAGVHWASDVAAGKMVAASVFEYLKRNPEYQVQFRKAKAEVDACLRPLHSGVQVL